MDEKITDRLLHYAFFTAIATSVYFAESMAVRILPLPFLRIGLANVIIVYLLVKRGFVFALTVNVMKTVLGGLISFTLMSPATMLSLSGGLGSLLVMWLLLKSRIKFSIVGVSIAGAVAHNIIQVYLVRWLIIRKDSVLYLLPVLIIIGIVTGFVTGLITSEFCNKMMRKEECPVTTS